MRDGKGVNIEVVELAPPTVGTELHRGGGSG